MFRKAMNFGQYAQHVWRGRGRARDGRPVAVVEMRRVRPQRRLFQLCRLLIESGYECWVPLSRSRFALLDEYGLGICRDPRVRVVTDRFDGQGLEQNEGSILHVHDGGEPLPGARELVLRYDVFDPEIDPERALYFPILFHPKLHDRLHEKTASKLYAENQLSDPGRMAVFFAGRCDLHHYHRPETGERFGIHTRWQLFDHIRENTPEEILYVPTSWARFQADLVAGQLRRKLVLVDTNEFEIPTQSWLPTLARADYFVHMPGYVQPFCHSQVEALAVGAIPLTEFPSLYRPAFRSSVEGFSFSDPTELLELVRAIVAEAGVSGEREAMRRATARYYREHLSFGAFATQLARRLAETERVGGATDLYMCAGEESMGLTEGESKVRGGVTRS